MRNDYLESALEKYMDYAKSHIAYGMMEQQQIARTNISLIDLSESEVNEKLILKHIVYENLRKKLYVRVPAKFLVPGERLDAKDMRKIRYKLFTIHEITKMFGSSVDMFYNGKKIPYNEIRIALFDFYFVVELPIKYRHPVSLTALLRPYVYDEIFNESEIVIRKDKINKIDDNNDFFLYIDGKQNPNFTITEDNDNYNIKCADKGKIYEINYIRHLNYYGKKKIKNNHINIIDKKLKFPIPGHNILTFNNGLLIDLGLITKTDGIYKCNISIDDEIDLFFVYKDYEFEDAQYNDPYRWLSGYLDNFMDIIDNPNMLPEFANKFELFKDDISLQDYLANKYTDIKKYNFDKSINTIKWCEECLITLLKYLHDEYMSDNQLTITSQTTDIKKLGKESLIRKDNFKEILNEANHVTFNLPMVVIKVPNKEEYSYAIYIDGIKYTETHVKYRELGVDYLYLNSNDVEEDSFIEVEKYETKYTGLRNTVVISDGSNKIIINNAKLNNFINSDNDVQYITLSKEVGNRFINKNDLISSIDYNKEIDRLSIILKDNNEIKMNDTIKLYNINFHKSVEKVTRTENRGLQFKLSHLQSAIHDINHIRVFKNGREIPRNHYNITFPEIDNDLIYPILDLNVSYGVYELIEVEFNGTKCRDFYFKNRLKPDGIVDLYNPEGLQSKYMSDDIHYYTMNGIRVTPSHYKYWCSKGITLTDYDSTYYFSVVLKTNNNFDKMINLFNDVYEYHTKLLDKYIMELLYGSLYDEDGNPKYDPDHPPIGPGKDGEDNPCTDPDPARRGKLYNDLYHEFLKLNIINMEAKMPEYIMVKYGNLIDSETDVLKIDANDRMLHWMPLDADSKVDYDESTRRILDLYYKLLDNIEGTYIFEPGEIPDELYEQYNELFDNGVLVLQVPEIPQT